MNSIELESKVVEAAKWMSARENSLYIGWNPSVLTKENFQDQTNLGYSPDDADMVFSELKKRGFLIPCHFTVTKDGEQKLATGYKINEKRKMEWIELQNKSGSYNMIFEPILRSVWGEHHKLIKSFIGAILLAFFAQMAANLADYIIPKPNRTTSVEIISPQK